MLNEYKPALMKEFPKLIVLNEDNKEFCHGSQEKVTYRTKVGESDTCLNWYHLGCDIISESKYANIPETVWFCMNCKKNHKKQIGLRMVLEFSKLGGKHS